MNATREPQQPEALKPRLLSVRRAADYLSISTAQVKRLIQAGVFRKVVIDHSQSPHRDAMRKTLIKREAIDQWVDSLPEV